MPRFEVAFHILEEAYGRGIFEADTAVELLNNFTGDTTDVDGISVTELERNYGGTLGVFVIETIMEVDEHGQKKT